MAAFDFPTSPTIGQEYTANGVTFIWNGYAWDRKPVPGGGGGGIPEAPIDGFPYVRSDAGWDVGIFSNAFDGKRYVRKDADWIELVNPADFSCVVGNTVVQSIPPNAVTQVVNMDTVDHDPAAAWSVANSNFVCKKAGLYSIDCKAVISQLDAGARLVVFVYKNGVNYAMMGRGVAGAGGQMAGFGGGLLIPLVLTDTLDMRVFHANAAATDLVGVGGSETRYTTFAATFIG